MPMSRLANAPVANAESAQIISATNQRQAITSYSYCQNAAVRTWTYS